MDNLRINVVNHPERSIVYVWGVTDHGSKTRARQICTIHVPPEESFPPSRLFRWCAQQIDTPPMLRYQPPT